MLQNIYLINKFQHSHSNYQLVAIKYYIGRTLQKGLLFTEVFYIVLLTEVIKPYSRVVMEQ